MCKLVSLCLALLGMEGYVMMSYNSLMWMDMPTYDALGNGYGAFAVVAAIILRHPVCWLGFVFLTGLLSHMLFSVKGCKCFFPMESSGHSVVKCLLLCILVTRIWFIII